ncbi:MAG: cell division protein FtsB, partial [Deinococcus sp.]
MRPPRWKLPAWRPPSWRWPRWRRPDWQGLRSLPLSMMLASLLAGLGAVQMTFLIGSGLYRSYTWGREGEVVRRELATLKGDIRVLRETRSHADDPEELRAQARCL